MYRTWTGFLWRTGPDSKCIVWPWGVVYNFTSERVNEWPNTETTMLVAVRSRLFTRHLSSFKSSSSPSQKPHFTLSFRNYISHSPHQNPNPTQRSPPNNATRNPKPVLSETAKFVQKVLFVPPGVDPEEVTDDMILPGSNIVLGPYVGEAKIKDVEFVKSSNRPKDCPKDDRPEFAMLGRSNVGKSSLINSLVRKKEVALTSKKPGFF